jgi:CBS-domain-containing membrane protein
VKVRDLLTAEVVTVSPTTPIKELARLVVQHRIRGMPVVEDGGRVVGVVSDGDLLFRSRTQTNGNARIPGQVERRSGVVTERTLEAGRSAYPVRLSGISSPYKR